MCCPFSAITNRTRDRNPSMALLITKYLRQKFGYGAKRIIKDHPEKNWGLRNVGYLLKKLMKPVTLKAEKNQGDLQVAGLKITSMQSKS